MNAPTTDIAVRSDSPIDKLKTNLTSRADEFRTALPSHINVDKFQRTIATAAMSNPQLLDCDRRSLLLAAMKLAQDGLLPDGREAALVPFQVWNKETRTKDWQVQPMPMAYGLRKKILQSGQVVSLETGLVYRSEMESGHFIYEVGMDPPIRHRPKLDLTAEEMADEHIVAAYSIARIKSDNGDPYWSVEVMRRSEIDKVRQASQTGAVGRVYQFGTNKGKPIEPKGPWVEWYGEMARKTVLRRHSKVLPMSGDIFESFERDREEELRAEGAAQLLRHEPDAAKVLPSRQELDGGDSGEGAYDPETGEVMAGATEIDRKTLEGLRRDARAAKTDEERAAVHELYAQWISDVEGRSSVTHAAAMAAIPSYDEPARDPATGMTQVDEETARKLDAGEHDDDSEEERADDGAALSPAEQYLATLRERIAGATDKAALKKVDEDWTKHRAAHDDEVASAVDGLITAKRRALAGEEG